ncbi:sulfite exporter TauE/SafE family protein [Schlesneria paludicola]|uniref:sulfite exporter TauE/SafE family protein n=1 Tax=Schlesneria paludicola TaxID=360056 RepID=UPI00029A40E5|nr:sulfite exporter TauE/SafE family protein [Schlesneria paludicola]
MIAQLTFLCATAFVAGAINSVAGGGTLLTFPALTWILGSTESAAVIANATSTFALFPGSIAATWGYRREMTGQGRWITPLIIPSLMGSVVGTLLVVTQPEKQFQQMVPWLILVASALFLMQPAITRWTGIGKPHAHPSSQLLAGIVLFQFVIALYGGYFGAGIGILMLSSLALMGLGDIHQMNALKSLLASAINGMSVVVFIAYQRVDWSYGVPMLFAGIAGGFVGASVSRRLDRNVVRWVVIAIGFGLATYYFTRVYGIGQT